jgi:hypothetical protein
MATVVDRIDAPPAGGEPFFRRMALVMAIIIAAGFTFQVAMGRSTFAARPLVHVHALVFFGWVALFLTQIWLVRAGDIARHRLLGRVGAVWVVAMVIMGIAITVDVTQRGIAPFFFQPQHFLVANPLGVLCFAGITAAAIVKRRESDWHRRLHLSALALLMGPAFGRLLPMPFMIPYAFEAAGIAGFVFIIVGMMRDWRVLGRVHAAWAWGLAVGAVWLTVSGPIARSSFGDALYQAVTAGHPGESVPGLAYAPPPPGLM